MIHKSILKKGLLFIAFALLVIVGQASAQSVSLKHVPGAGGSEGIVSGQGTQIVVEVSQTGITQSVNAVQIQFDFDMSVLTLTGAPAGFLITGGNTASLLSLTAAPVPARASFTFTTATDVTGVEFSIGISSILLDGNAVPVPLPGAISFNATISAGSNANAVLSLDLIANGGAGNQRDDGVTSGTVSGQGTKIAVEVFATGVTTSLLGVQITFDFKAEELKLDKVENSAFLFALPEPTGVNFAATAPVTLPESGFLGRAEFSTVADVTDKEFYLGIKSVTLAESAASSDVIAPEMMAMMSTINFNVKPRLVASADVVPVPPGGTGSATVMAVNFAADATITFDVQGEMIDVVQSMQDGATLTLTASGPAKATVMASDGTTTTDPITIEFAEVKLPALDANVSMAHVDDGMTAAGSEADAEISIEVFAGDIEGGIVGASIVFAVDPADAATITGFTPAEGLTLLGIGGNQVDVGAAEEAVMLSAGGYVGTLTLRTGDEVVPFTVGVTSFTVLASFEMTMLSVPAPVMFNFRSTQNSFSLSLDVDGSAGDQSVTSANVSTDEMVAIEIFGLDIRNANGLSVRFEYDAGQVTYDGFAAGDVLPNAQALPAQGTGFVEIGIVSLGGQATANSGLVGTVRFRTTAGFSGTVIRLVRAELGRGGQIESMPLDVRVELKLEVLTPDFNRDGKVDFADFLAFAGQYGLRQGDGRYEAKYDLDSDGVIGFGDFLIFSSSYGQ